MEHYDHEWLKGLFRESGRKPAELARHLGVDPSAVSRMQKGERKIKVEELTKIKSFFGILPQGSADYYIPSPLDHLTLRPDNAPTLYLPVLGEVAAGVWLDVNQHVDETAYRPIPYPSDPRYPHDWQYGLVVRGTSINRVAKDGDILGCLDYAASGIDLRDQDIVIVERTRHQEGTRELTAKVLCLTIKGVELRPDSTDTRWGTRDAPNPEAVLFLNRLDDPGDTVRIKALVRFVHQSLIRDGR